MQNKPVLSFIGGVIIGAGVVFLYQPPTSAPAETLSSMMSMADHDMHAMHDMMVTSERAFIEQMIPHHQEAIDTAQEVLERGGTTDEMRALAQDISDAQREEIAQMRIWYADWYSEDVPDVDYKPMMRPLDDLEGEALDQAFLEDMIMHHMGAIMMARSVEPYIEHTEIETLAAEIVRTQSAEIEAMQEMLTAF